MGLAQCGTDLGDDKFEGRFKLLHISGQSAHQLPCLFSIKEGNVLSGRGDQGNSGGKKDITSGEGSTSRHSPGPLWGPLITPTRSRTLQLAIPEQVAEKGPPHVQSHAFSDAGQEHQIPKGQQTLGERQGHSGEPRHFSVCPGPPLLPYLEAIEDEQVGAEIPGLFQEVAHVVPCVLGHNLHQLAQE